MTELKARVSGLKTFCTARYLRKATSRGSGRLSISKDISAKRRETSRDVGSLILLKKDFERAAGQF